MSSSTSDSPPIHWEAPIPLQGCCSIEGCTRRAVIYDSRYLGCSSWCGWQPCTVHSKPLIIPCPTCGARFLDVNSMAEYRIMRQKTMLQNIRDNRAQIQSSARRLRPGPHKVVLKKINKDFSVPPASGGMSNINAEVDFSDGVQWLARIKFRLPYMPFPHEVAASEAATLQCLHRVAGHVIPNAWMPLSPVADLSLSFIERRIGTPHESLQDSNPLYMLNLIQDYAKAVCAMTLLRFDGIGSLVGDFGCVGPEQLVDSRLAATPEALGPFKTMREYMTVKAQTLLDHLNEDTYRPKGPLFHYLALLEIKSLANEYEQFGVDQPTYITHTDPWGDHLLVHEGRLSGIIDWECAMTLPLPLAVQTPWLNPSFASRQSTEFSEEELRLQEEFISLGRPELAEAHKRSRYYSIPWMLLDCSWTMDNRFVFLNEFRKLCGKRTEDDLPPPTTLEQWILYTIERHFDDLGLQAFLRTNSEASGLFDSIITSPFMQQ